VRDSAKYQAIRKNLYAEVYESELRLFGIDLTKWTQHPYTKFKSYYYIEFGAILAYFLLKTRVTPNAVTLAYALCGIVAAVLMVFDNDASRLCALFIWFSKSVPDWIDGYIARTRGLTSRLGALLDSWGAHVNVIAFQVGVSIYVALTTSSDTALYLAILILSSHAVNFRHHAYQHTDRSITGLEAEGKAMKAGTGATGMPALFVSCLKNLARRLRYDGRSRYTDLVLLCLLWEIYAGRVFLSAIVVWVWALTEILYCAYTLTATIRNCNDLFG
jgi:phosphatidylglycerophosphate synthase